MISWILSHIELFLSSAYLSTSILFLVLSYLKFTASVQEQVLIIAHKGNLVALFFIFSLTTLVVSYQYAFNNFTVALDTLRIGLNLLAQIFLVRHIHSHIVERIAIGRGGVNGF